MAIGIATVGAILSAYAAVKSHVNTAKDTVNNKADDLGQELGLKGSDYLKLLSTQGSITSLIGDSVIEPTIVLAESLRGGEVIDGVIDAEVDTFINLYIKSFETLFRLYGLDAQTALTLLSSKNKTMASIRAAGTAIGLEDLKSLDTLPEFDLEDSNRTTITTTVTYKDEKGKVRSSSRSKTRGKGVNSAVEKDNLIIKKFSITIDVKSNRDNPKDNGNLVTTETDSTFKFDLLCKANIRYVPDRDFINLAKAENKTDKSFLARLTQWRASEIDWIDFFTGRDLLREDKRARIQDNSKLLKELDKRVNDSEATLAHKKVLGYGRFYNIIIIDNRLQKQLETILRGKFRSERVKDRWLDTFKSLIGVVYDKDYETVSTYVKDLSGEVELGFKKFKSKHKNDNSDLIKFLMSRG